ncbi:MAG: tRNA-dihydrouridine synthase [Desulfitobacteriaceae bacterium]
MKPYLSVEVWGKKFKNPIVVASATPTKDADYMKRCVDAGAGGLISKTVTYEKALQKYVSPRFTVLHKKGWPHAFSNYSAEFLATYTPDEWMPEMEETKKYCEKNGTVLIGSISGDTLENWGKLAKMMENAGADMIECNFGCPHPRDLGYKSGQELGSDPEAAAEVSKIVVDSVKIPVIIKLTAEAVDPVHVAKKVAAVGASGVTVHNRFPALDIDIETGRPLLHSTFAGIGGPWMRPIMLKWVAKVARSLDIPISATNGIWTWEDVVKAIMVGASTVQTTTAIMYGTKKFGVIEDFIKGMESFMESKGYNSITEMRGITLSQLKTWDVVDRESRYLSQVDPEKCTGCKLCLNWCFFDAISMDGRSAVIDRSKCDGCGLCPALCPKDAITMDGPGQSYLGNFR